MRPCFILSALSLVTPQDKLAYNLHLYAYISHDGEGESDVDHPESEEDEMDPSNPYPLEGKFIDEADRAK